MSCQMLEARCSWGLYLALEILVQKCMEASILCPIMSILPCPSRAATGPNPPRQTRHPSHSAGAGIHMSVGPDWISQKNETTGPWERSHCQEGQCPSEAGPSTLDHPHLKSWLCCLMAVWLWGIRLTSLSHSFLTKLSCGCCVSVEGILLTVSSSFSSMYSYFVSLYFVTPVIFLILGSLYY